MTILKDRKVIPAGGTDRRFSKPPASVMADYPTTHFRPKQSLDGDLIQSAASDCFLGTSNNKHTGGRIVRMLNMLSLIVQSLYSVRVATP